MDIKTDIEKQINAGFTKDEILKNLREIGYSDTEINQQYTTISSLPEMKERHGTVKPGSVLIGILALVVMMLRISRFQNSGNVFLLIGVVTAGVLAILYFTKRS